MTAEPLNRAETTLLERVAASPVSFTHAPNARGTSTKLVRSSISPSRQAQLVELTARGYVSRAITGSAPHFPLETTVTYTLTALGRVVLGLHARTELPKHRDVSLTDEQLEREGCR